MRFSPGELTREDADKLNEMLRQVEQLSRISATPPLSINKSGFNPILSLSEQYLPLLAEITAVSGTTYTVKRKTRDSTNAVVDMSPGEIIHNVVSQIEGADFEVGDLVNIESIPDWPLPEQWWWATPVVSLDPIAGGDSFIGCGWLLDVPKNTCMAIRMLGGWGSFTDMPSETRLEASQAVYVGALAGWIAIEMKDTCCGCGGAIFKITDEDAMEASLVLDGIHVECVTGTATAGLATITMTLEKCGRNADTGQPFAVFVSKDVKACGGTRLPCQNVFRVEVECADCPDTICACNCAVVTPWAWYTQLDPPTFTDDIELNGTWVWTYADDLTAPCKWTATCTPTGTTSTLEYIAAGNVWRLTHGGFVYELASSSWLPEGPNTLDYVSGTGAHPASIQLIAIRAVDDSGTPIDSTSACVPGDTMQLEVSSPGNEQDGISVTLTRSDPALLVWSYGPDGDGLSATVSCDEGRWTLVITGTCQGVLATWSISGGTARPTSVSFDPVVIDWVGLTIVSAPPDAACGDGSTADVTVTEIV